MLNANSRQFFNRQMKGRRARIRNQKRSKHYRSWLDRSLDNYAQREEKIKQKEDARLRMPKRSLYRTEGEARADRESYLGATIFLCLLFLGMTFYFMG